MIALRKEVERQKELMSSDEVKIRWTQNKLKIETDLHKVNAATCYNTQM